MQRCLSANQQAYNFQKTNGIRRGLRRRQNTKRNGILVVKRNGYQRRVNVASSVQAEKHAAVFGAFVKYFKVVMMRKIDNCDLRMIFLYFIAYLIVYGTVSTRLHKQLFPVKFVIRNACHFRKSMRFRHGKTKAVFSELEKIGKSRDIYGIVRSYHQIVFFPDLGKRRYRSGIFKRN